MNRRTAIQVTAPSVIIGLVLLGSCLASVWSINRLQRNLANILSDNVASLEASQELEIRLRQLRFHSLMNLMDPNAERRAMVEQDHQAFEQTLERARTAAGSPEEKALVRDIQHGYQRYRTELAATDPRELRQTGDFVRWADAHPVRHLTVPSTELLRLNKKLMEQTAVESESVSAKARVAMLILGILGPLSGLISGYGIARGISRSISRLSVRLQDVRAHLDQDVGTVQLPSGRASGDLDRQLDLIASRVRAVAEQVQRHQQEILRAEQLAAVGQLAASVAHEVRNPLTSIKLLVGATLNAGNQPPLSVDDLQVIHGEVIRLEHTVQGLLDFARPPRMLRERCDLRDVIGQALDLTRARAKQLRVEVRIVQPEQPVFAEADRAQVTTVLVNLIMNALDALPHGGTITLTLDPTEGGVRVRVRDNGTGIPAELSGRLFTPFATGKTTGTGLGLSICRRIVQEHGGTIVGGNAAGGGAEFVIDLPTHQGEECCANAAGGR